MGAMHGLFRAVNTALGVTVSTITGTLDIAATSAYWRLVSASAVQNVRLPATTGLTAGWAVTVRNVGTAALTLQTSGGGSTLRVFAPGDGATAVWDGSLWRVFPWESSRSAVKAAATGSAVSVDFAYGTTTFTPNAAYTVSLANTPPSGEVQSTILALTNGGAYTPTWPTVTWSDGSAPTLTASGVDLIQFLHVSGTTYGMAA